MGDKILIFSKTLQNQLRWRMATLRGAHCLAVFRILSRSLRAVRLALHPTRRVFQGFLSLLLIAYPLLAKAIDFMDIAPGVYVHYGQHLDIDDGYQGDIGNISFVVGAKGVAVIDSGGSLKIGRAVREAISRVTPLPVLYVINTHVHPDHIFGNIAFLRDRPQFVGHTRLELSMHAREDVYRKLNVRLLGEKDAGDSVMVFPTMAIADTTYLDLGGRTLTLTAYGKAHTDNDLTVVDQQTATLFAGDLLFIERTPVVDGDVNGFIEVLSSLAARQDVRQVVPGHGSFTQDWRGAIANERRYLETLLRDIRICISNGVDLQTAKDSVAANEKANWVLFEITNRRNVNNVYPALEWE